MRLRSIEQFFGSYHFFEILLEMAVIWVCVYIAFRFLKGTRGAGVIKGFAVLLVLLTLLLQVLGQATDAFGRLNFFYDKFLGLLTIVLIVVFQPELRQAMVRLGHARWFRGQTAHINRVVEAVDDAVQSLSRYQFGALIAIERSVRLGGLVEGGVPLDAELSSRLLESIFWPNNPLHDLGVVVRGNRIVAASVQFPLAEEGVVRQEYGSRHRAAVGLTLETDCLVVVVSEETGGISIAEAGHVENNIPHDRFRARLAQRLESPAPIIARDEDKASGSEERGSEPSPPTRRPTLKPALPREREEVRP